MSIELCVLASGSSGNCSMVRTPGGVLLIDAGIGPRAAAQRMGGTGVGLGDISAICLTHLDHDHFCPTWIATLLRNRISIFCHANRVRQLLASAEDEQLAPLIRPFASAPFEPVAGLTAQPIALAHDASGSHAFLLEGFRDRLGYATDLGQVPPSLVEQFADVGVLALESNYDPRMQDRSTRPEFLKRRITSGRGHLSNEQALDAVRRVLDLAQRRSARLPAHIVLLHRSRQCNCPRLLRRLFSADARIAPRLVLAEQNQRTDWLCATHRPALVGEQLLLAWG